MTQVLTDKPKRKYAEAWQALKEKKLLVLRVTPAFLAQVKKGMIKEKDEDLVFKLLNETDQLRLKISYNQQTLELKFQLLQKFGIEEIKI